MGQAKRRGTLKERIAQAQGRSLEAIKHHKCPPINKPKVVVVGPGKPPNMRLFSALATALHGSLLVNESPAKTRKTSQP